MRSFPVSIPSGWRVKGSSALAIVARSQPALCAYPGARSNAASVWRCLQTRASLTGRRGRADGADGGTFRDTRSTRSARQPSPPSARSGCHERLSAAAGNPVWAFSRARTCDLCGVTRAAVVVGSVMVRSSGPRRLTGSGARWAVGRSTGHAAHRPAHGARRPRVPRRPAAGGFRRFRTDRDMSLAIGLLERPAAACRAVSSSPGVRRTSAVMTRPGACGPFAAGQQPRRFLLGGVPGLFGEAEHDGGFGARFGGVQDRTQVLKSPATLPR